MRLRLFGLGACCRRAFGVPGTTAAVLLPGALLCALPPASAARAFKAAILASFIACFHHAGSSHKAVLSYASCARANHSSQVNLFSAVDSAPQVFKVSGGATTPSAIGQGFSSAIVTGQLASERKQWVGDGGRQ